MKRLSLTLALLIVTLLGASGYSISGSHLTFMGIPINGTIANFQPKLVNKGFKYDAAATRDMGYSGVRLYTGRFNGSQANVHVAYNPRTNIVYNVSAFIDVSTQSQAASKVTDIAQSIYNKYENITVSDDSTDDNWCFYVYNTSGTYLGHIVVSYKAYDDYTGYFVMVAYYDSVNLNKAKASDNDDL